MKTHQLRVVALAAAALVSSGVTAPAADHLLSGTIASTVGEKLGGVTVSAKAQGSTITPASKARSTSNGSGPRCRTPARVATGARPHITTADRPLASAGRDGPEEDDDVMHPR